MGSVGSVQCQVVCFSGLYLFSRSIVPPKMQGFSINCRILIGCTCDFQGVSPSFVHFGKSVCKTLQCLISTLPRGDEGGHLCRLTCSVVLWEGRDTANKYHWHVWGVLAVDGSHWVCHSPWWQVLTGSTLLRLQGALQGYCPKWALFSCTSQVQAAQPTRCLVSALSQVSHESYAHTWSWLLHIPGAP